MASITSSRPTHYETLGISPHATSDEIARAYAREILKPRAFGGLAQVGIAFATLKDAAKRRAYDEAIGIAPKPEPKPLHASWSWSVHVPAPSRPSVETVPPAQPGMAPPPVSTPARQPEPPPSESLITASLRQLADPAPIQQVRSPHRAPLDPPPPAAPLPEVHPAIDALPLASEAAAIDWRRPALIGGALLLAATLAGAWAGTAVRDPDQPLEYGAPATVARPAARASANRSAPADEPVAPAAAEEKPIALAQLPARAGQQRPAPPERSAVPRPIPLTPQEEQELAGGAFAASAASQAPDAAAAMTETQAAAAAQQASAARMPWSDATVARTIGRIGYACGSVASITAVDGGAGVFKVTCTSGQSYQARPVRGRYHFRRWGRS